MRVKEIISRLSISLYLHRERTILSYDHYAHSRQYHRQGALCDINSAETRLGISPIVVSRRVEVDSAGSSNHIPAKRDSIEFSLSDPESSVILKYY